MDWLTDPQIWIALGTLTFLEIVLGVDNIIFISILSGKLLADQQPNARRLGLLGALGTRILLLMSLAWIIRLTQPLFTIVGTDISGRDLILILGGLFLLAKATYEIHDKLEGDEGHASRKVPASATACSTVPRSSSAFVTAAKYRVRHFRISGVSTCSGGRWIAAGSYAVISGQGTCGQFVPTNRHSGLSDLRFLTNCAAVATPL